MKTLGFIFGILVCFSLIECAPKSEGPKNSEVQTQSLALSGTWERGCSQSDLTGGPGINKVSFTNENFSSQLFSFDKSGCPGSPVMTMTINGKHSANLNEANQQDIDLNQLKISMVLHEQKYVDTFNSTKQCGHGDWQLDVSIDVTGENCITGYNKGVHYSIIKISDGKLFLGRLTIEKDGSSPDNRPTDFDPNLSFTKAK